MLRTAHWRWRGHSAYVAGHEEQTDLGLESVMNNHCFTIGPNAQFCASCHVGYGWDGEGFDFTDRERIDCLVCHDTTGTYRKQPGGGGDPAPDVDLVRVARSVGRPGPDNCGACHYLSGGARNSKRGDLEDLRGEESVRFDVHLAQLGMRCQECHETTRHQIAGRSVSAPASEGRVACESCHGPRPHGIAGALGNHLDEHVKSVACESCHIPMIARQTPTRLSVDFSTAGREQAERLDENGWPAYQPRFGEQQWAKDVVPAYRWYDGTHQTYAVGDPIDPSDAVELNRPLGERYDPLARIHPFKVHEAVQPYDMENEVLLVPQLAEGLWEHWDWSRALAAGSAAVGLEYSGSHGWVRTRMYTGIHHEVVPSSQALGCADCHEEEAVRCQRCHTAASGIDLPDHRNQVYPGIDRRMDFEALGYPDDPARSGGRFYTTLGRGTPVR
jgi:octaheme c-type cytochrome (tetrathionate reductase family)